MNILKIPMFPLSIFPLPGEMIPLHIFEPRYQQLLEDAEANDMAFGIYYNHVSNTGKFGSLVKLESVIKRYAAGESDIIVKCVDLLSMSKMFRTFREKLYPGGEVELWHIDNSEPMGRSLRKYFTEYFNMIRINQADKSISLYDAANELNLGFEERVKFVQLDDSRKESFLVARLKYHIELLHQVEKAKDVFHLN
ncbi:MAG: hypothetical protein JNM78_01960 [Cyclobacteriaceae bacterium]|nr:hypothetical protein [Cyclobacteriaceae bacterium]